MSRWLREVRSDVAVFDELAPWWNAQPAVTRHPLLHSNILRTWRDGAFEEHSRLRVHLLLCDGRPVAGLPLYRVGVRHRNIGRGFSNGFDVVHEPSPDVVERLSHFVESVPFVDLRAVDSESPLVAPAGGRRRWSITQSWSSPRIDLSAGAAAAMGGLSTSARRSLRRARRSLEMLGPVAFDVHRLQDAEDEILLAGLELEARGWKGEARTAVLTDPHRSDWFRRFVTEAAALGWLHTAVLRVGDDMAAFDLLVVVNGVMWGLVTAYDHAPEVARGSPGLVIKAEIVRWAAGAGVRRYDLGYGSEPWKEAWMTDAVPLVDIRIFGRGVLGRGLQGADLLRSRLRRP